MGGSGFEPQLGPTFFFHILVYFHRKILNNIFISLQFFKYLVTLGQFGFLQKSSVSTNFRLKIFKNYVITALY